MGPALRKESSRGSKQHRVLMKEKDILSCGILIDSRSVNRTEARGKVTARVSPYRFQAGGRA